MIVKWIYTFSVVLVWISVGGCTDSKPDVDDHPSSQKQAAESPASPASDQVDDESGVITDLEPDEPMSFYVTPYYNSIGPQINVGTFSKRLTEADAKTIDPVIADMKKEWNRLPVEAMYVTSIRLYGFGHKDEAVYWFRSARQRVRLLRAVLTDSDDVGSEGWELCQALMSLDSLSKRWITGYAMKDPAKEVETVKTVLAESEKELPEFTATYPSLSYIPHDAWAAKNKEIVAKALKTWAWAMEPEESGD